MYKDTIIILKKDKMATVSFDAIKSKIDNAANGHYYIHIAKKDGMFKLGSAKLSSYITNMSKDNGFIYMPTLRMCGNYKVVTEYLTQIDSNSETINHHMATAYTIHNYDARENEIKEEIANIPKNNKSTKNKVSLESIIFTGTLLKANKMMLNGKDVIPEPSTPKEAPNQKDLKVRLHSLEDGMALDISAFDPETKTGTRRVKRTTKGTQKSLGSTPELNRIVFARGINQEIAIKFLQSIGKSLDDATAIVRSAVSPSSHSLDSLAIM
jgi:hypothetical protein